MKEPLISHLVNKLIDWLFVLLGVTLILWFIITMPVFSYQHIDSHLPTISKENLKGYVKTLVKSYSPRTVEYGNLNITAHYIYDELSKFKKAEYQSYWTLGGRYSNVLLELGPDTKEVFIVGAHYDAESSSLDIEGNASGVATLIELARHLSKIEDQLPIKVQLITYPLSQTKVTTIENMGSYIHAESIKQSNKEVRLMMSLDGVGQFNSHKNSQKYPFKFMRLFYPDKGDYISLIGQLRDFKAVRKIKKSFKTNVQLPLYSFNVPQNYSPTDSVDHLNYQKFGFPAVLLTDTAGFRQPEHKSADVIEQLDYEKMTLLVKGLYQLILNTEPSEQVIQMVHFEAAKDTQIIQLK